jgi:hypothetical protein
MKFNFGNRKSGIAQYIVIAITITSLISLLSLCTGVSEIKFWDILDEIQRKYFPGSTINDFIIKDPEKLDRRIKKDVDTAIENYWKQIGESPVKIPAPIFSEKPIDSSICYTDECKSLGGEMRLCSPWIPDCIKEDDSTNEK